MFYINKIVKVLLLNNQTFKNHRIKIKQNLQQSTNNQWMWYIAKKFMTSKIKSCYKLLQKAIFLFSPYFLWFCCLWIMKTKVNKGNLYKLSNPTLNWFFEVKYIIVIIIFNGIDKSGLMVIVRQIISRLFVSLTIKASYKHILTFV